uniref:Mitotic spindle assembly checkpoint protein MAD2B-like n=1 Tax=Phallusia mammillata TaxID=59560 RepID=A0A6F9DKM7_9ASCI|nr:mitotic spindle assembly checkpoint protein MAD2B-like [Phallusia mammillata]
MTKLNVLQRIFVFKNCSKLYEMEEDFSVDIKDDDLNKLQLPSNVLQDLDESSKHEITADLICEFLQVAVHQILYMRSLYPKAVFVKRKKYGIPVFMSCHPQINSYIDNVIDSLKAAFAKDAIQKVVVVITEDATIQESFVFEINHMVPSCRSDDLLIELEQSFRDAVVKLFSSNELLKIPSQNLTFEIHAHVRSSSLFDLFHSEDSAIKWVKCDAEATDPAQNLLPVKSISHSSLLQMQLFIIKSQ